MILHFMLIEKKSFVVTIKQEDLEKYTFNIDILKILFNKNINNIGIIIDIFIEPFIKYT